jgi:pimeloyl-ACP methyl ester carboxylesterase
MTTTSSAGSPGEPIHLILLPGLDGTDVFLRPLLARLPSSIVTRPILFPDAGPCAYPQLLDLVRRQLVGIPACYVLACSFSGPLAVMLAAAAPDQVRGLILVATFLRSPRPALAPLRFAISGSLVWTLRFLRRLPIWLRPQNDAMRAAKRETWARVSARGLAGRARAVLTVDVRDLLRSRCRDLPVLSVSYEADTVVARRWSDEIIDCSPSAQTVVLPGGHLGLFDDPQRLAAELVRFIELDPSRTA